MRAGRRPGDFSPGIGGIVYAGDFVDRGPDAPGCLDFIERYATEVLVGNHELAVLLGFSLSERTPESCALRQVPLDRVLSPDSATRWKAVSVVGGLLLSHAVISQTYRQVFQTECNGDPTRLATHLNQAFLDEVRRELLTGDWDPQGVIGEDGPLWFRPRPYSSRLPLGDITQVVGHTPPPPDLETSGFYMVDPCAFPGLGDSRRYRYAVIERGCVSAREGSCGPDRPGARRCAYPETHSQSDGGAEPNSHQGPRVDP